MMERILHELNIFLMRNWPNFNSSTFDILTFNISMETKQEQYITFLILNIKVYKFELLEIQILD